LDEFIKPSIFAPGGIASPSINDNDAVIFWNFRPDRAKQITSCFMADEKFDAEKFKRSKVLKNLYFATMSDYEQHLPVHVAFPPIPVLQTLPEIIAQNKLRQLHIAETEKYAHVTYFFNGEREVKQPGEERILIPSPKVATYDLKPEMSAVEITDAVIPEIEAKKYDAIIMNYANADMVGHTGIFEATVK
jgi:2,3-bisphosphoglycerate-independent phosphoglycerate mutase